jgi:hypothetical protein
MASGFAGMSGCSRLARKALSARTISIKASSAQFVAGSLQQARGGCFGRSLPLRFQSQFYKQMDGFGAALPVRLSHDLQSGSGRRNIRWRLSLLLQQQPRGTPMRITTIAIGYGFALSSTFAPAQAGGGAAGGSAAGSSAGSPGAGTAGSSGTAMSGSGSSTGRTAGSANGPGATTNPSGSTIGAALPDPPVDLP